MINDVVIFSGIAIAAGIVFARLGRHRRLAFWFTTAGIILCAAIFGSMLLFYLNWGTK